MPIRHRAWVTFAFTVLCVSAAPARAVDGPLLLFGGRDHDEFLGCLNCYRSEAFSIWNEKSEHGDPAQANSIWNQNGPYGSRKSPLSPWNPRASNPPLVVDRAGQLYGYLTLNSDHPNQIGYNYAHPKSADFRMMAWLLENYDWVVTHLQEVRVQYDPTRNDPPPSQR